MKIGLRAVVLLILLANCLGAEENVKTILSTGFENADLSGWRTVGDLCVAPSFCAGEASGRYWLAMSTGDSHDPVTMCGYSSVAGLQTILRSPNLLLPFPPSRIRLDFKMKFMTAENTGTDLGTDQLIVRLLTSAGPILIAAFDDSGPTPDSKNLTISGDTQLRQRGCTSVWQYETGMLSVSYYRLFREPFVSAMFQGPVALEFALSNQFDADFDSAVVLDDITLRVYR